jgi:hypothetical protein
MHTILNTLPRSLILIKFHFGISELVRSQNVACAGSRHHLTVNRAGDAAGSGREVEVSTDYCEFLRAVRTGLAGADRQRFCRRILCRGARNNGNCR